MAFYSEFPHTRNYDTDLGFLIERYNKLLGEYEGLKDIYEVVKNNIKEVTEAQIQEWYNDGTLAQIINEQIFNQLNDRITALEGAVEALLQPVYTDVEIDGFTYKALDFE